MSVARRVLALIQRRHPLVVQQEISDSHADLRDRIDNMIISLSVADELPQAASGSDDRVRTAAVKDLVAALAFADTANLSTRAALLARAQDTSSPAPSPNAIRLHFAFLAAHVCRAAAPESMEDVLHKILFPFLLFSKARQHAADIHELLAGCTSIWRAEKDVKGEADGLDRMLRINQAVASKLAGLFILALFSPTFQTSDKRKIKQNIIGSKRYSAHFSALIRKSHEADPNVRVLAFLVIRALLSRLSGERRINAAHQALEAINL
ncbi:hypothetical protein C8J57DRAFT_1507854 [Mycena rebaudengoi]|nr:hypothetical protein C8J57DRAFT_1507854 [Mycena rebaudengoi]